MPQEAICLNHIGLAVIGVTAAGIAHNPRIATAVFAVLTVPIEYFHPAIKTMRPYGESEISTIWVAKIHAVPVLYLSHQQYKLAF